MPSDGPPSPVWGDASGARIRAALVLVMPLLALIPKYWIIHSLYPPGVSLFDTGFGFAGYVRSLLAGNGLRMCSALPFKACSPDLCVYATRMPVIPLLLAALDRLTGSQAESVALAKSVAMALLSTGFLATLVRDFRIGWPGVVILYFLYFGPQSLKHGAALDYEEGILIDLSLCLAIAACYLIRRDIPVAARRSSMALAGVMLAASMYLTKTTALLTVIVMTTMVMTRPALSRGVKVAAVAVILLPMTFWGWHNWNTSGAIHLSSSWNGENLVRGYDTGAAAIYPEISLDRIFDSRQARLDNGSLVPLGNYTGKQCFTDEWQWSSTYSLQARRWLADHPLDGLRFTGRKVWVTLLEIRHTPTYTSATQKSGHYASGLSLAMVAWMVGARVIFFLLVGAAVPAITKRGQTSYIWALVIVLAACAPYMLVFAYQRHLIPILLLAGVLFVTLFLSSPRPAPNPLIMRTQT